MILTYFSSEELLPYPYLPYPRYLPAGPDSVSESVDPESVSESVSESVAVVAVPDPFFPLRFW